MLANDLPVDLKQTTDIVVFDVSDQTAAAKGKARKKGKSTARTCAPFTIEATAGGEEIRQAEETAGCAVCQKEQDN
jgi:hypothetical protein